MKIIAHFIFSSRTFLECFKFYHQACSSSIHSIPVIHPLEMRSQNIALSTFDHLCYCFLQKTQKVAVLYCSSIINKVLDD